MLIPFLALLLLAAPAAAQVPLAERLLLIEDARSNHPADVAALRDAARGADPELRRTAVRALGRLERPEWVPIVAPALGAADARLRAEAANAIAQMTRRAEDVAPAMALLAPAAKAERDPEVREAVFGAIGRLPFSTDAEVRNAEQLLIAGLPASSKGFESLVRLSRKIATPWPASLARLRATAVPDGSATPAATPRQRRLALAALTTAGAVDRTLLEAALSDADEEVRRLGAAAAAGDAPIDDRGAVVTRALRDASPQVRYEGVRAWGRHLQEGSCEPIRAAAADPDPHVALLAIDLLGAGCPASEPPVASMLETAAAALPADGAAWHKGAHALVSLARVAPDAAKGLLSRHAAHGTWQVRMYAARAAGTLQDAGTLDRLTRDAHDNVREAALAALVDLKAAPAVPAALNALARPDYQLVMTAARALQTLDLGAQREKAVASLREAFGRIAAERRDTSRDAREAIRKALSALGDTVTLPQAPASAAPLVTRAAVLGLGGTTLRFVMAGKGHFDLRLLVDEAPLTVLRVATRAREGYYNGLTFHRVVPNFVIQGGSPGANEYVGDGPFMRDEVGLLSHVRGTVGISTRGRDTGDAQIFVNLADLPRLDHIYTVFAEVSAGMDVVDGILEGDVIERVELVPERPR